MRFKPEWIHGKISKSQQDTVGYILWRREQLPGDERGLVEAAE